VRYLVYLLYNAWIRKSMCKQSHHTSQPYTHSWPHIARAVTLHSLRYTVMMLPVIRMQKGPDVMNNAEQFLQTQLNCDYMLAGGLFASNYKCVI